jgi:hypothetical protein
VAIKRQSFFPTAQKKSIDFRVLASGRLTAGDAAVIVGIDDRHGGDLVSTEVGKLEWRAGGPRRLVKKVGKPKVPTTTLSTLSLRNMR